MTKIVYSPRFGGFGVSEAGIRRYAEIKGLRLWVEPNEQYKMLPPHYWLVPKEERLGEMENWDAATPDERRAFLARQKEQRIYDRDLSRTDPVLVQVVEELGEAASSWAADLQIAEVSEGTKYRIDEYDGNESVMTVDDYEWSIA